MELGSQVCKPVAPDCAACPVRAGCRAYAEVSQDRFICGHCSSLMYETGQTSAQVRIISRGGRMLDLCTDTCSWIYGGHRISNEKGGQSAKRRIFGGLGRQMGARG